MKTTILIFFIFCLANVSCSKDNDPLRFSELAEPSAMNVFCQKSPDDTLRKVEYDYDNGNLVNEATIFNGEIQTKTTYVYNADNQLTHETFFAKRNKTEKAFIYNELNQVVNIIYKFIDYDSNGQVVNESESEAPREYKNNQLVKEWQSWGGFITYEYKDGKVVTKINHKKHGTKHHITTYKYSGDLLIEEKQETKTGSLMYLKSYIYDSHNRLITVKDRENIIEENDYTEDKLVEKRTYYFGIDPGYDICYGNYIFRYEY